MSQIDEIKSKIDIVEVIREYAKLQPAGRNWKAICPFHKEKTPSFMVSSERQIWHCFGCGRGGDVFAFIMEAEKMEFKDALKIVAKKAGVELKRFSSGKNSQRNRLIDIHEWTKKFFNYCLQNTSSGKVARDYLKERKVPLSLINEFSLGYAPKSWEKLWRFLKKKNFSTEEIISSGLVVKNEKRGSFYDRFRNRLMFPINNIHGQTVGFSGRALDKSDSAKYINSPQTLIYNKSEILYGLDKAKNKALLENFFVLVEGQMDLVAAYGAGTFNTVATSGTALTKSQIKILHRYASSLYFAFDADEAGEQAIKRGIDLALSLGMEIKIIKLPQGKDPDDLIKENKEHWFSAIEKAQPILDYFFEQNFSRYDASSLEGKKKIVYSLLPLIEKVADPIEKNYFLKKLSQETDTDEETLRQSIEKIKTNVYNKEVSKKEKKVFSHQDKISKMAEEILALFLIFPENTIHVFTNVSSQIFGQGKIARAFQEIKLFYKKKGSFSFSDFLEQFKKEDDFYFFLEKLHLLGEKDYLDFDPLSAKKQIVTNLKELEKYSILNRKKFLQKKIFSLEKDRGNKEEINGLLQESLELDRKLMELENEN